jgi:hypothetical protein
VADRRDRSGCGQRVGVHGDHHIRVDDQQCAVERGGLVAVGQSQQAQRRIPIAELGLENSRDVIVGPVVGDHDLLGRLGLRQQDAQRRGQRHGLVVRGDEHAECRPTRRWLRLPRPEQRQRLPENRRPPRSQPRGVHLESVLKGRHVSPA